MPCRASPLDGKVGGGLWVFFSGCRPDLLPCRASPLDGRGWDTLQGISHAQSLPLGGKPSQVVCPCNKMLSHPTPAPAKCESKSGHVHGLRNSPTTGTMRPTTPKRASGNERVIKKGGGGGHPPATLCVRAFSRESLDPRPGPGGKPRRRAHPATVPTGPPTNDGGPPLEGPRKAPRCLHRAASSPNSAQVEAPVTRTSCQVPMTAGSAARWTSRPPAVRAVRRPSSPWPSTRQRRVLPT